MRIMNKSVIYFVFVVFCVIMFVLNMFVGFYLWNSILTYRITYETYILEMYFVITNILLCLFAYGILKQRVDEYGDYRSFITYNPHISGAFFFLLMLSVFSIYLLFQINECKPCLIY